MSFKITISEDGEYIIGKLYEPLNRETARRLTTEFIKITKSTGINKILNDARGAPNAMNILHDYEFAYTDTKVLSFPKDVRAAILTDPGDDTHAFQETVARNAGYFVKIFSSYDQAVAWLLEDSSKNGQ